MLVKVAGAGVVATSHTTGAGGYATFSIKPTKAGKVTFTLSKTGCITTTLQITSM